MHSSALSPTFIKEAAILIAAEWGADDAQCFEDEMEYYYANSGMMYGCFDDKKLIGIGVIAHSEISFEFWGICWLVVNPKYRNLGVGKAIVAGLESHVVNADNRKEPQRARIIQLSTKEPVFYEKSGYTSILNWNDGKRHLMIKIIKDSCVNS